MDNRNFQSAASASPPTAPASPSNGYPTNGNPTTGTPATQPGSYWFHKIGEELRAVITGAGITPADTDLLQVSKAIQSGGLWMGISGGTADVITATFTPGIIALTNGMSLNVRAGLANATTTPTFTPNSGTIVAKQIVKGNGLALATGDIAGAGHWIELQYDLTLDKWVLLNPANGVTPNLSKQIQSFTATTASNILTGVFAATSLDYRSATATTGTPVTLANGSLSLAVPAASNLGMVLTAQVNRLIWLVAYNAGTPVLCVVNLAGGNSLDETGFISPTTISGTSNLANVIYSASAVSANSPYRVIGFTDVIFTTGTGWSAPTLVQGTGGQALAAMSSLGYGQTLTANLITSSVRLASTTYYNTTGKPIMVYIINGGSSTSGAGANIYLNGVYICSFDAYGSAGGGLFIVPPFNSYMVIPYTAGILSWYELR